MQHRLFSGYASTFVMGVLFTLGDAGSGSKANINQVKQSSSTSLIAPEAGTLSLPCREPEKWWMTQPSKTW